jgi:hypothetical protein
LFPRTTFDQSPAAPPREVIGSHDHALAWVAGRAPDLELPVRFVVARVLEAAGFFTVTAAFAVFFATARPQYFPPDVFAAGPQGSS